MNCSLSATVWMEAVTGQVWERCVLGWMDLDSHCCAAMCQLIVLRLWFFLSVKLPYCLCVRVIVNIQVFKEWEG